MPCDLDDEALRLLVNLEQRYAAWMDAERAKKPTRNPLKRPKDEKQGTLLLSAIAERMPHYSLDDAFRDALPPDLVPYFDHWRETARP